MSDDGDGTRPTATMAPEGNETTVDGASSSEGRRQPQQQQQKLPPLTKIMGLARPELRAVVVAFLFMVASEGLTLYIPLRLANAYDFLVEPGLAAGERMGRINRIMVSVVALHLASVAANFLRSAVLGAVGERVVARLRNQLYGAILRQEIAFFDEHKTGELVSRLGSDTTLLQQATSMACPEVVLGITKLFVSMGLMFWISASLAAVTLGFVFIVFCLAFPFGKWMGSLSKTYQNVLGEAQTHSTEALGAMRTVQSFAAEDRERKRYRNVIGDPSAYRFWWPTDYKSHRTTYGVGFFKSIVGSGFFTFVFGFGFGSLYLSLWYGFKLVTDGVITLGDLTAFQSYIFQIGSSLGQTSRFIQQLIEAQGASGRIFYLLERVPAIPKAAKDGAAGDAEDPKPPCKPATMEGTVEFTNVNFCYPSRPTVPVLRNFTLTIPANTTAALVGSSGSGKSTVVALLQRFYDVDSGSIRIDGIDIRDLDLRWLRERIGFVQQEPSLFGLSCRENVTYGVDRDVSDEELEQVCRKANAHDFIVEWPEGYDTLVGERGVKLSGGQKQRLAIARSLLVDPRLLLLDEATSALDAESEHLVQQAIDKAVVGRTVLIVAHRLSTIQRAQQIVVVDDCQIVDVGSHNDLLRRCSKYQDLIKRQSMTGSLPSNVLESLRLEDSR